MKLSRLLLALLLTGCITTPDGRRVPAFDFKGSLSYNGITISDTVRDGRRTIGVDVDAKQIVRATRR